jgi:hypothetical protein
MQQTLKAIEMGQVLKHLFFLYMRRLKTNIRLEMPPVIKGGCVV